MDPFWSRREDSRAGSVHAHKANFRRSKHLHSSGRLNTRSHVVREKLKKGEDRGRQTNKGLLLTANCLQNCRVFLMGQNSAAEREGNGDGKRSMTRGY